MTAPSEGVVEPHLDEADDKDLVLAFKRGEDGSYQAIHERYSARVKGICRRMLDHSHDAEEASQETFMRVYTALPNFNGRYQLGAWMSRIATNVCLDQLRGQGRRPSHAVDHETLAELPGATVGEGPEDVLIAEAERKRVRAVLAELSPMHRAAIALREFEGMSYNDIAIALGMTEPQVKALLHRARKSFKRSWGPVGAASFLPWRLIARIRRVSGPSSDASHQVADAATSTMHVATQCSTVLQQCGHFVTERVATAVTALVVGTAAVGMAVAPTHNATPIAQPATVERGDHSDGPLERHRATKVKPKRHAKTGAVTPQEPDPDSQPQPQPQPSSSPTSSPEEPAPTSSTPPSDNKSEKPPANPSPPPFFTYFGWDRGQPIPRAQATSHSGKVDCLAQRLTHRVETLISDGAFSFRAVFDWEAGPRTARLQFGVHKDGTEVRYSSWGAEPVATWTPDGSKSRLEITGEYGALHGFDPDAAKLPRSGAFHATLTLDCAAQTVVTEGASFSAQ